MKHIVFPTYELHPVNPGGAGVLVAGMVRALANAGVRSTVLCDFPEAEVELANAGFAGEGYADRIRAVSVRSLGAKADVRRRDTEYETNSAAFALALVRLHAEDPVDLVEFPEYAGIGFAALRDRLEGGVLHDVRMVVRIHGSLEAIDRAERVRVERIERLRMHRTERLGMQLADVLFAPSLSLGESYRSTYELGDGARVQVAPPPMYALLAGLERAERLVDPYHFLFYGKLQEVKGCDLLVEAGVGLIADLPTCPWRFTLVGRDTHCSAHGRATSECLKRLIPRRYALHFEFVPPIARSALATLGRRPVAAVIPSRFETFCLAAHELRAVGLPVVVSDIPAFQDYFREETGGVRFDRSAADLMNVMKRLSTHPSWAAQLAEAPPPRYLDPAQPYLEALAASPRQVDAARLRTSGEALRLLDTFGSAS